MSLLPNESNIPIIGPPEYRVVIAMPAGDSVKSSFAMSLAAMMGATGQNTPDIQLTTRMMRSTILPSGRQKLALSAVEDDATHILWLDTDMVFPKETLLRLLMHEKDIVGANYAERKFPFRPTAKVETSAGAVPLHTTPESSGLQEVKFMGFGCVLMRVSVFKALKLPWFQLLYRRETADFGGEDTFFCYHARDNGYKLYVDHDLSKHVRHVGEMEFSLEQSLQTAQALAANATQEK